MNVVIADVPLGVIDYKMPIRLPQLSVRLQRICIDCCAGGNMLEYFWQKCVPLTVSNNERPH